MRRVRLKIWGLKNVNIIKWDKILPERGLQSWPSTSHAMFSTAFGFTQIYNPQEGSTPHNLEGRQFDSHGT